MLSYEELYRNYSKPRLALMATALDVPARLAHRMWRSELARYVSRAWPIGRVWDEETKQFINPDLPSRPDRKDIARNHVARRRRWKSGRQK